MLPPLDDDVLVNNPDFERVYRKVTGGLLNPDGSTRDDEVTAKKRDAVRQVRRSSSRFLLMTWHLAFAFALHM